MNQLLLAPPPTAALRTDLEYPAEAIGATALGSSKQRSTLAEDQRRGRLRSIPVLTREGVQDGLRPRSA